MRAITFVRHGLNRHNEKPGGETGLDSLRNQALAQACAVSSPHRGLHRSPHGS